MKANSKLLLTSMGPGFHSCFLTAPLMHKERIIGKHLPTDAIPEGTECFQYPWPWHESTARNEIALKGEQEANTSTALK